MVIKLKTGDREIKVRPGAFLSGQYFRDYLDVLRRYGRFDQSSKAYFVEPSSRQSLVNELMSKGFSVEEDTFSPTPTRGPNCPEEVAAARGLVRVAALDPDGARDLNGVGFSGVDVEFGHKMAQVAQKGMASDKQWAFISKLAHKYRKQISQH